MNYAIAYLDSNGRGFSKTEPFIENNVSSYNDAVDMATDMFHNGMHNVTVFECEGPLPEYITWDFVEANKLMSCHNVFFAVEQFAREINEDEDI